MFRILLSCLLSCISWTAGAGELVSPDSTLKLRFELRNGTPVYSLTHARKGTILAHSRLGFDLREQPGLLDGFVIERSRTASFDETWQPVLGEEEHIRNRYNELFVELTQSTGGSSRLLGIRFRLYDDSLGFRYEFPEQPHLSYFQLREERSEFRVAQDCRAYWIPGDYDSNEFCYQISSLSALPDTMAVARREITSKTLIGDNSVQTPLLLRNESGLYVNIHEAALVDYPAMSLDLTHDAQGYLFTTHLTPGPDGSKGRLQTPFQTPWRTVIVSDDAAGVIRSKLVLNLNEPCALDDHDWIRPMKYMGIWWEMFVPARSSWSYTWQNNLKIESFDYASATPHGRHGATTSNACRYIDFAARNGFDALLIEGWNIGWEDWCDRRKERVFDFLTPYPDFDLDSVTRHARRKGIKLIMHHETAGSLMNYERYMDRAYAMMNRYGYPAVKSGYVGPLLPAGEYHYGQTFVNHLDHAIRRAADFRICVNVHEPQPPTGYHRTYPNFLSCESARGTEYEGFASLNPDHVTILPFTRLVGGPMDYTPGIFQTDFSYYDPNSTKRMKTTIPQQLALYVVIYSPLQMAADLPENYERFPDAFEFIKAVPADWAQTEVLEAEPGEYVTIARKAKGSEEWFVGSVCNGKGHTSRLTFEFLDPGKKYEAIVYTDGEEGGYDRNPQSYEIRREKITSRSRLTLRAKACGGCALHIRETTK